MIQQLLIDPADPFALAMYLWTVRGHDLTLVNGDRLAAWGAYWADQVLIRGEVGRRADEEITSAALAAAALASSRPAANVSGLQTALLCRLEREFDNRLIPFGSPGYAAALLYAASVIDVVEPRLVMMEPAVINAFEAALPAGPLFGLGFATALLRQTDDGPHLADLDERLRQALTDVRIGYEDELHVVQALWILHGRRPEDEEIIALTERVVTRSPVWSYLLLGVEDVESAGDGQMVAPISHLYRAELLDVLLMLQEQAQARADAQIDARYRGRILTGAFAFLGILTVLIGMWGALAWQLLSRRDAATGFWIQRNYNAMTIPGALLFLIEALAAIYLAMFTPVVLYTLWSLMIRSAVESDLRIAEVLGRRAWRTTKLWATVILLPIFVLVYNILSEPMQHIITGR